MRRGLYKSRLQRLAWRRADHRPAVGVEAPAAGGRTAGRPDGALVPGAHAAPRSRSSTRSTVTSAAPDAFRRLAGPALEGARGRAQHVVLELPARPVLDVYSGPLHEGLDAATLSPRGTRRAPTTGSSSRRRCGAPSGPSTGSRPTASTSARTCTGWTGSSRPGATVLPGVLAEAAGRPRARRRPALAGLPGDRHARGPRRADGHAADRSAHGGRADRRRRREAGARPGGAAPARGRTPIPTTRRELAAILGERWPVAPRVAGPARRDAPPDAVRGGLRLAGQFIDRYGYRWYYAIP